MSLTPTAILRASLFGLIAAVVTSIGFSQEAPAPVKRTPERLGVIEQMYLQLTGRTETRALPENIEQFWWKSFTLNRLLQRPIEVDASTTSWRMQIPAEPDKFKEFALLECKWLLNGPRPSETLEERVATYQKAVELSVYLHEKQVRLSLPVPDGVKALAEAQEEFKRQMAERDDQLKTLVKHFTDATAAKAKMEEHVAAIDARHDAIQAELAALRLEKQTLTSDVAGLLGRARAAETQLADLKTNPPAKA